jgi:hypothetical protein
LIPNLYDWGSRECGLKGNKVACVHGVVLSFYVCPLSW